MNLQKALQVIEASMAKAQEMNVPVYVAVVDQGGSLIAQQRMDGALLVSEQLSRNKAYTAVTTKMSTDTLNALAQPGQPLYGIEATEGGRIVVFGGGYPLQENGEIIGAVGVSGGSVDDDMAIAAAGLAGIK